jgi:signal transduction histidine kinase
LASLRILIDTLQNQDLDSQQKEKVIQFMITEERRLEEYVSHLLGFHELDNLLSLKNKIIFQKINLKNFLLKIHPQIEKRLQERYTFINNQQSPIILLVIPDSFQSKDLNLCPIWLQILINNLIDNSYKYAHPHRRLKIIMYLEKQPDRIILHFRDNAIGIDPKDRKKVFRKYFQLGHISNMTAKGPGFGLYFCQQIMKLFHGKIFIPQKNSIKIPNELESLLFKENMQHEKVGTHFVMIFNN